MCYEKKLDIKRNDERDRRNNLKRKNEFEFFHIFQIKKNLNEIYNYSFFLSLNIIR